MECVGMWGICCFFSPSLTPTLATGLICPPRGIQDNRAEFEARNFDVDALGLLVVFVFVVYVTIYI